MKELFRKFSNLFNLFKEERMPEMAGAETGGDTPPEPKTEKPELKLTGTNLSPEALKIQQEQQVREMFSKAIKNIDLRGSSADSQPLEDLLDKNKIVQPKTELAASSMHVDVAALSKPLGESKTPKIVMPELLTDPLKKAVAEAEKHPLNENEAATAMLNLTLSLARLGHGPDLQEGDPAIERIHQGLNGIENLDTALARLHVFNREIEKRSLIGDFKGAKKDLISSIKNELESRNQDNPILLADLGRVAPTGASKEVVPPQKPKKTSSIFASGGRPSQPPPEK